MKNFKKVVALFLFFSLTVLTAAAGFDVNAAPPSSSGVCGPSLYWSFDSTTLTLTVSGSGNMYDFTHDTLSYGAYPWASESGFVQKLVVEEGCTKIGSNAFVRFKSLSSVTLPKESLEYIGASAFEYCQSLVSISVPDCVTAIGEGAFRSCLEMRGISFGEGISDIPTDVCSGDASLSYVKLGGKCRSVGIRAFYGCSSLENIDLSGLEELGQNSFYGCSSLKSVHLGDDIRIIGNGCFSECFSLEELTIDGSPEYMEGRCGVGTPWYDALPTGFTVRFDTKKLFYKDDGRETVVIPEEAKIITASAFISNSSIKEVIFHDGVEIIESNAFYNDENLTAVYIPDSVREIGESAFGYYSATGLKTRNDSFVIRGRGHGEAYRYAVANGITYECCHEFDIVEGAYRCALCDFEEGAEYVSSCTHDFSVSEFAADCESGGYVLRTCRLCGVSFRSDISPALGHSTGNWEITLLPDCSRPGEITRVCTVCGKTSDIKYIEKTAHVPSEKEVVITEASCVEDGAQGIICTVCGEVLSSRVIYATGHEPGDWVVITVPSEDGTVPGFRVRFCRICGKVCESEWFVSGSDRVPSKDALEIVAGHLYEAACGKASADAASLDFDRNGVISVRDVAALKRLNG